MKAADSSRFPQQNFPEDKVSSQRGLPGRFITLFIIALLAFSTGGVVLTLNGYAQLDSARNETDSAWRKTAEELELRYRILEKSIARLVDARSMRMESGERFRLAIDGFRTTAQPIAQASAAAVLERFLDEQSDALLPVIQADVESPALTQAIEVYNGCAAREALIRERISARLLLLFIHLPRAESLTLCSF